jgi:excisionase family DNA binding protein
MSTDKLDEIYTVADVAKALRVGPQTVRALLRGGRLKGRKYGREWAVRSVDVRAILKPITGAVSSGKVKSSPRPIVTYPVNAV